MSDCIVRREFMSWPGRSAYPSICGYSVRARGAVEPIAVFLERADAEGFRDAKNSAGKARRSKRR